MTKLVIRRGEDFLERLYNPKLPSEEYGATLYSIGEDIGAELCNLLPDRHAAIKLVCTSEDADFLTRGVLKSMANNGIMPSLTVFWHRRYSRGGIDVAPVIMKYDEPIDNCETLIIVKSIISSSCTVATQITNIFDNIHPKKTIIASPVVYREAIPNLLAEFPNSIISTFNFMYIREDDMREGNLVIPGIGGDVEQRLGIAYVEGKPARVPSLVQERISSKPAVTEVPFCEVTRH